MERNSFALEHLEGRTLFSVVAPMNATPMMATTALHATPYATTLAPSPFAGVAFNVAGTYVHPVGPIGNPDTGSQYQFTGLGKSKALGAFTMTGQVSLPGFIAIGRARGQFRIKTAHGTITLSVVGPPQTPGSLPSFFSFSIAKGTGKYAHSSGKGKILVSASGTTQRFLFRFRPAS